MAPFPVRKKRVTQADVARLAGVSQAAVSYVLNGLDETIAPETRQRIHEAAERLRYVPDKTARALRTARTGILAAVVPNIANPYYPVMARAIQEVTEQHGYSLIVYNTDAQADKEHKALRSVQMVRAEGVIGVFFHLTPDDMSPLFETGVPMVWLGPEAEVPVGYHGDHLYVDNVRAAATAVTYLLDRGHRRIAILTGSGGPAELRLEGYRQALAEHGLQRDDALVCHCPFTEEGGYVAAKALLAQSPPPTAIFAANDLMALGALLAAREAGVDVPGALAIVGFDNISMSRLVVPPLTTVAIHQDLMGRRAAEMLLERLGSRHQLPSRSEEIPFDLIIRKSA